jgi:hypothetical protein
VARRRVRDIWVCSLYILSIAAALFARQYHLLIYLLMIGNILWPYVFVPLIVDKLWRKQP